MRDEVLSRRVRLNVKRERTRRTRRISRNLQRAVTSRLMKPLRKARGVLIVRGWGAARRTAERRLLQSTARQSRRCILDAAYSGQGCHRCARAQLSERLRARGQDRNDLCHDVRRKAETGRPCPPE